MSWTDFYGFKSSYGGPGGQEWDPSGQFGYQNLNIARRGGHSAMSILEWLKPGGTRSSDDGTWRGTTREGISTDAETMSKLRSLERTELGMKRGYEKMMDMFDDKDVDLSGYAKKDDLSSYAKSADLIGKFADKTAFQTAQTDITGLKGQDISIGNRLGIVETTQQQQGTDISEAMTEAQKVRTTAPSAIQSQSSPIGIQGAQSPSAQAGMISAGLAGLSRSNKKFKNKTLNIS